MWIRLLCAAIKQCTWLWISATESKAIILWIIWHCWIMSNTLIILNRIAKSHTTTNNNKLHFISSLLFIHTNRKVHFHRFKFALYLCFVFFFSFFFFISKMIQVSLLNDGHETKKKYARKWKVTFSFINHIFMVCIRLPYKCIVYWFTINTLSLSNFIVTNPVFCVWDHRS